MSNLPGKITDPHLSAEEPLTFRRFPCRIRAILYAAAIFTCILTGKAPASNDNTPQ